MKLPTRDDVLAAQQRIATGTVRTPSALSLTLSAIAGTTVILKFENLQFTGSFKERGALNRLLAIDPASTAGVVAMSAGNHALGVAYHASRLGIPATIVMPEHTPSVKVLRARTHDARVVLHGADISAAAAEAHRLESAEGLTFIHPFDDPLVIAGQGTVALELLADHPEIDTLVVPVGGGGLLAGIALAAPPDIRLVAVQSEQYPSLSGIDVTAGPTIAEGIAVPRAGERAQAILKDRIADVMLVSDAHIEEAVGALVEVEKTVVEGAGAAGLAAVLAHRDRFAGRTVGLILSGGNIDNRLLSSILLRGLVRAGRLVTLHVRADDRPGSLARIADIVGRAGGNIVDVRHSRLIMDLSVRSAEMELVVEVTDAEQAGAAVNALRAAGYPTEFR